MKLTKQKRLSRLRSWTQFFWFKPLNFNDGRFIPGAVYFEDSTWKQERQPDKLELTGAHAITGRPTAMPVLKAEI